MKLIYFLIGVGVGYSFTIFRGCHQMKKIIREDKVEKYITSLLMVFRKLGWKGEVNYYE